jgi:hypothetical protein
MSGRRTAAAALVSASDDRRNFLRFIGVMLAANQAKDRPPMPELVTQLHPEL